MADKAGSGEIPHRGDSRATRGLALIAIAATMWGAIPIFVREVDASPLVVVFWRVAFALVVSVVALPFTGGLASFRALTWKTKGALALQGALLALNWVLFFTGLQWADVAVAELLAYCGPVFVAALAPPVLGEAFDRRIVWPLALALGGTAVILLPHATTISTRQLAGAAAAFASAFTYALLITNGKRLLRGVPLMVYMTAEWVVAGALLLPAALVLPGPDTAREWAALAALGIGATALTGIMFVSALRWVRADRAATLTYLEPTSAVLFAAAFLGEPLTATTVIGGGLVLTAGIVVARMGRGESRVVPASIEATEALSCAQPAE